VNKTFVPNIVESFRKIAKEETDNLRSNCKVLIVDGWTVECFGKHIDWYLYIRMFLTR
jgi:hypothetical protein